tara:strand:+ start:258 stop:458 length:201 start_codon:yes stop_codon:yes gene_type:complete
MQIKKLLEVDYSYKEKRTEWEQYQDYMYRNYLIEKKAYGEYDTLSKADYLTNNKMLLEEGYEFWTK